MACVLVAVRATTPARVVVAGAGPGRGAGGAGGRGATSEVTWSTTTHAGWPGQAVATRVERCAQITHVSADGADIIVATTCPGAVRVADPFHVVRWVTEALDEVRRGAWNEARALARSEPKRTRGRPPVDAAPRPGSERAKALKGAGYSLWKNPENLSKNQRIKLAWIAATDPKLYRAHLLKEGLRLIFTMPMPPRSRPSTGGSAGPAAAASHRS